MDAKPDLRFENFQLDRRNQELRRDSRLIALPPKTFSVLQYLAENPARLVTQEELLKALWGPIAVGLKCCCNSSPSISWNSLA